VKAIIYLSFESDVSGWELIASTLSTLLAQNCAYLDYSRLGRYISLLLLPAIGAVTAVQTVAYAKLSGQKMDVFVFSI